MPHSVMFRQPIAVLLLGLATAPTFAASFSLLEQSTSRLGTAFAGTAAAVDDATAVFFNPAGIIHLDGNQFAASLSAVSINSEFSNVASQPALGQSLGNAGGNAGGTNWVPSMYFSSNFESWAFGFGVNAPFGLKLEYTSDWLGRFQAQRSEIKTLNFNPEVAYRMNRVVTFAIGIDYQKLDAELTNAVNYSAVIAQVLQQRLLAGQITLAQFNALVTANAGSQGHAIVSGDDWAWGANAGLLFDVSQDLRFGLAYRSPITYHVNGNATFNPPTATEPVGGAIIAAASAPGGPLSSGPITVTLKVPGSVTASYWQRISSHVELLADIAWTQWSSIPELRVVRTSGTTLSVTPENWDDTWRIAFGATYALDSEWKLRAGAAYDQTPVPDSTRTPRLPDADRTWLAIGAQWAPTAAFSLDFGYAHLFMSDVPLNQNAGNAAAYGLVNGNQSNSIDIFSAQVAVKF
jgi:long-chain fatty acid transport protein